MMELIDPTTLTVIGGGTGGLCWAAYLFRGLIRRWNRDVTENTKDRAESDLYKQLSEQVKEYRVIADSAFKERNELIVRVTRLEAAAEQHKDLVAMVERLKARLDEKDATITKLLDQSSDERKQFLSILTAKDMEIARRDQRILTLETGMRALELRIAKDEATMGIVCPLALHKREGGEDAPAG